MILEFANHTWMVTEQSEKMKTDASDKTSWNLRKDQQWDIWRKDINNFQIYMKKGH